MSNDIERRKYAETFCKIQQLAGRIANEFNDKLDWLRKVDDDTPRIEMLDCCIYETHDINLGRLTVLVEERLDESKWQKWNANNGYVQGMKAKPIIDFLDEESAMLKLQYLQLGSISAGMSVLHEVDEELDEREEEDDHAKHKTIVFSPFDVAQAFSHFSYWATGKKRLICDIQGIYDEERNMLRLSDPVIHYQNFQKAHKKMVHGKTDRGTRGCLMFFETHKCSKLCHFVTNGFKIAGKRRREVNSG